MPQPDAEGLQDKTYRQPYRCPKGHKWIVSMQTEGNTGATYPEIRNDLSRLWKRR